MSRRRSAQQWEELISEFQESGLSVKAFCLQQELTYSNFYAWRKRFASPHQGFQKPETPNALIDLSQLLESSDHSPSKPWKITLRLGNGIELQLDQQ